MDTERHPVHLFLNQEEIELLNSLFKERITRTEASIKNLKAYPNESSVKQYTKLHELEERIEVIQNLSAELSEQTAW